MARHKKAPTSCKSNGPVPSGGPRRNYIGGSVGFGGFADEMLNNHWFNGQGLTFMVNAGTIYFVSLTGNDGTGMPGSIANPYRTVQTALINNAGNTPNCPIAAGLEPVATVGVWGLIQPGDFIVMRGGTWTDVSRDGFFCACKTNPAARPPAPQAPGRSR